MNVTKTYSTVVTLSYDMNLHSWIKRWKERKEAIALFEGRRNLKGEVVEIKCKRRTGEVEGVREERRTLTRRCDCA